MELYSNVIKHLIPIWEEYDLVSNELKTKMLNYIETDDFKKLNVEDIDFDSIPDSNNDNFFLYCVKDMLIDSNSNKIGSMIWETLVSRGNNNLHVIGIIYTYFVVFTELEKYETNVGKRFITTADSVEKFEKEKQELLDNITNNSDDILYHLCNVRNNSTTSCNKFCICKNDSVENDIFEILCICKHCSHHKDSHSVCNVFVDSGEKEDGFFKLCGTCGFLEFEHIVCDNFSCGTCQPVVADDTCLNCGKTRSEHIKKLEQKCIYRCGRFENDGRDGCKNCIFTILDHIHTIDYFKLSDNERSQLLGKTCELTVLANKINKTPDNTLRFIKQHSPVDNAISKLQIIKEYNDLSEYVNSFDVPNKNKILKSSIRYSSYI